MPTDLPTLLERYQRLIALSCDLASTLDLDILLNRIVHAAADLSHAEAASILLYDELHNTLHFQTATNLDTPLMRGLVVPVDASIAGWIVKNQQPAIVLDTKNDPRHFSKVGKITQVETQSLLGVPLIARERVIGVLEAINKRAGEFNEEDQELLMALGGQAATAIENARLFQQSDLISELVHEIRTPLASLTAATHLLKRWDLKDELRGGILDTMEQEIARLSEMTSAFLDIARLESGRAQFQFESVNLNELIPECVVIVGSKVEQKGQRLEYSVAPEVPLILADYNKIKQVCLNLLNNAMKYTPEGGKIEVTAHRSGDEVVIRVSDTGIGIPAESLPHLFEKFYRVPGTERHTQGTGLGLSICRRIVEAHSGRIEVKSQPGRGSTFSIFLPLKARFKTGALRSSLFPY